MPVVVSDTSPLRALAHLAKLDLLRSLFGEVFVPPGVIAELRQPRRRLPALDLSGFSFIRVQAPSDQTIVTELLRDLDLGESQAIALAIELGAKTLLMDEASGRSEAKRRGLQVTGVLGVLRDAKTAGLVPRVEPLIDKLVVGIGFFVLPALKEQVLRDCGERP